MAKITIKNPVTTMCDALEWAEKYDKKLLATDKRFRGMVVVKPLNESTSLVYANAFALTIKEWYLVFTEHYGYHAFHKDDNCVYAYSDRVGIRNRYFKRIKIK